MTYVSTILWFRLRSTAHAQKMRVGNIFLGREMCVKYLPMFRKSYCCHLQGEVISQCLEGGGDEKMPKISVTNFTLYGTIISAEPSRKSEIFCKLLRLVCAL